MISNLCISISRHHTDNRFVLLFCIRPLYIWIEGTPIFPFWSIFGHQILHTSSEQWAVCAQYVFFSSSFQALLHPHSQDEYYQSIPMLNLTQNQIKTPLKSSFLCRPRWDAWKPRMYLPLPLQVWRKRLLLPICVFSMFLQLRVPDALDYCDHLQYGKSWND